MSPSDLRASFFHKPWVRVKNASGEVVPPFSVLRVTAATYVNGEIIYTVNKPNGTFQRFYLVNGPFAIGAGVSNEGYASTLSQGGLVSYDNTGSGAIGTELGGRASSFLAQGGGYGLQVIGTLKIVTIGSTTYTVIPVVQRIVDQVYGIASAGVQSNDTVTITVVYSGPTTTIGQTIASVYNPGRYIYAAFPGSAAEFVIVEWNGETPTMRPRNGSSTIQVQPDSSITSDNSGTVSVVNAIGDTGDNVTALNGTAASVDSTKTHFATCYGTGSYVIL